MAEFNLSETMSRYRTLARFRALAAESEQKMKAKPKPSPIDMAVMLARQTTFIVAIMGWEQDDFEELSTRIGRLTEWAKEHGDLTPAEAGFVEDMLNRHDEIAPNPERRVDIGRLPLPEGFLQ